MQNLKVVDYTKKRLDNMYLVVYAIKNDINIKKGDIIVGELLIKDLIQKNIKKKENLEYIHQC